MSCTHTELSKFASPEENRFLRFKGQLDTVIKNAMRRTEILREIALQDSADDLEARREDDELRARFAQLSAPRDLLQTPRQ